MLQVVPPIVLKVCCRLAKGKLSRHVASRRSPLRVAQQTKTKTALGNSEQQMQVCANIDTAWGHLCTGGHIGGLRADSNISARLPHMHSFDRPRRFPAQRDISTAVAGCRCRLSLLATARDVRGHLNKLSPSAVSAGVTILGLHCSGARRFVARCCSFGKIFVSFQEDDDQHMTNGGAAALYALLQQRVTIGC